MRDPETMQAALTLPKPDTWFSPLSTRTTPSSPSRPHRRRFPRQPAGQVRAARHGVNRRREPNAPSPQGRKRPRGLPRSSRKQRRRALGGASVTHPPALLDYRTRFAGRDDPHGPVSRKPLHEGVHIQKETFASLVRDKDLLAQHR